MKDSAKRVLAKFKDMVETHGAKLLLAVLIAVAATCVGSVTTLLEIDGRSTAAACVSMAFYGFCVGWLCKWVQVDKLPQWRMRRTVDSLPRDQRAVLFAAQARRGAFRRGGDLSESRAGDDLLALESLGIVVRVKDGAKPSWALSEDARRLIDGNASLLAELKADHDAWMDDIEVREHRNLVDMARRDILNLGEFGIKVLVDLLKSGESVQVGIDGRDTLVNRVGPRLLDITPTMSGEFSIKASAIAREAAPLVFAEE